MPEIIHTYVHAPAFIASTCSSAIHYWLWRQTNRRDRRPSHVSTNTILEQLTFIFLPIWNWTCKCVGRLNRCAYIISIQPVNSLKHHSWVGIILQFVWRMKKQIIRVIIYSIQSIFKPPSRGTYTYVYLFAYTTTRQTGNKVYPEAIYKWIEWMVFFVAYRYIWMYSKRQGPPSLKLSTEVCTL